MKAHLTSVRIEDSDISKVFEEFLGIFTSCVILPADSGFFKI